MTDAASRAATGPYRAPGVALRIDGAELDAVGVALLSRIRVRREASAPAACALTFEDPAAVGALAEILTLGAAVQARVEGFSGELFTGEIVSVDHAFAADGVPEITARCQDAAHRLRRDSQLRVLVDVSVAEAARELASPAGLDIDAAEEGPRLPRVVQDGRSALDLLTSVTRHAGLWWRVDPSGRTLALFDDDHGVGEEVSVVYGQTLLQATVTVSALGNRSGWRVVGWDPVTGEVATGSADADPVATGATAGVYGGAMTAGPAHLDALARGLTADDRAASRSLRAVVHGDPVIGPGTTLVVEGLPAATSGSFRVLAADHVIDAFSGYTCTVTTAPPGHLRLLRRLDTASGPEAAALTIAEVLRIDDPDGRGRVRVALSAYDGLESEWLPVLALGAGEAKGLALQPDVGDHVLVAHDIRDAGRGVVLGGLRTTDSGEPGVGVVDGAVGVYGLRLPTGQSLRMSAAGDRIVIGNREGSRVELSDAGVIVHAEGDLVLAAPGHLLRLRAGRIELEQA
ncbi:phage baseplate assembly protein V [Microbacterium jiangjiandongii]|uniref:phage baseplate assembly protein V n=1 Tax=Microbacterium jiangjiandongii TaxID=3049071 RepID=UPI00214BC12D|nr:phage baseplate assembly protein V [Microbacterium sp. zg.Y843]MCR2815100.1 phage baseplate assembly protein V [Microbacterium sp. zg.Y843]